MGSIAYFAGQSSAPDGWVLCDGSAVSRTNYATLFDAVGTTYGTGDGSTTFALPNLIDKFVEGSATAGTTKAAGLPNITGSATTTYSVIRGNVTGALYGSTADTGTNPTTSPTFPNTVTTGRISFDASHSNSIYGKSSTVQPPALTMKPFIYTGKTSVKKWLRTA